MPSSKLLKERIESIQDTMKITNAMYLISSSKLRKARKNYQNVSPYFNRMRDTISRVVPHLPEEPVHPFFHERNIANPKRAYIVLTADKGMAGAYNQNIIKFLKENADENDRFYVIGQTGYRALYHKDPRLVEDFHYGATEPTLQRARDICCRWTAPIFSPLPRVWATRRARWRCSRLHGRCSSRPRPSTCTA